MARTRSTIPMQPESESDLPDALETVAAAEAPPRWRALLTRIARKEARVLLTKGGVPVAALIAIEDLEALRRHEVARAARFEALSQISRVFADVPVEELEAEGAAALAEVRVETRQGGHERAPTRTA